MTNKEKSSILPPEPYKRLPVILFYIAISLIALYLTARYLIPVFFPFIIAWIIALLLQNTINRLKEKAKIPKCISSFFCVLLFTWLTGYVLYLIASRAAKELGVFAENAASFIEKARNDREYAAYWINKIDSVFPFADISDWLYIKWTEFDLRIGEIVSWVSQKLLPILGSVAEFVPNALMYVFVIILSSFYFTSDFDRINRSIVAFMPKGIRNYFSVAKREMKGTLGKLLKAYGIIIIITFLELFIALSIMGVKYSLIIAFFTSIVDILPVLGTGTVLVPWAIGAILFSDTSRGIGLLATYGVISIVREIIEPKILGKTMGVHPLVTLVSMYVGLKFFGFLGLFLLPCAVTLVKNIFVKAQAVDVRTS